MKKIIEKYSDFGKSLKTVREKAKKLGIKNEDDVEQMVDSLRDEDSNKSIKTV